VFYLKKKDCTGLTFTCMSLLSPSTDVLDWHFCVEAYFGNAAMYCIYMDNWILNYFKSDSSFIETFGPDRLQLAVWLMNHTNRTVRTIRNSGD
jgi:hypothetical protein